MKRPFDKMRRWLFPEGAEQRRAPRLAQTEIVVHYWDGAAPEGREIRDISDHGAYILTTEQWYPGTIVRIILQGPASPSADGGWCAPASIVVAARVIRQGKDGVA